ncbi:MAG: MOSC N-terminal beta barrel domain-containing protein [Gammaproteobacteria bacterium]|nr:MOSC N-terminal beta barrel domain-containing protein [Gammaproteobacteria bacterium]
MDATVKSLHIYPVKGFKGIELESATLTDKGFAYDRHWMLINPKNQFVTQRQLPRFALVKVELSEHDLIMSMDGEQCVVALNTDVDHDKTKEIFNAIIWNDTCEVIAESEEVSEWLTKKLQAPWPLRLVRMRDGFNREVDQSNKLGEGASVTTVFADGFPFLIANQASLNALNEFTNRQFRMDRFRPNIVIETSQPFIEHRAKKLIIGDTEFSLDFPCERCVVTTIDQDTAEKDTQQEPLKSLIKLNPMPNKTNAAAFGQNASLLKGKGKTLTKAARCELE